MPDRSEITVCLSLASRNPIGRLASLREAFAESELSIRVDVLDWHAISEAFRCIIAAKFELLQKPGATDAESAKLEEGIKANQRCPGCERP